MMKKGNMRLFWVDIFIFYQIENLVTNNDLEITLKKLVELFQCHVNVNYDNKWFYGTVLSKLHVCWLFWLFKKNKM